MASRPDLRNYQLALNSPFDPGSVGARIPSVFAVPTVPAKIELRVSFSSDSSGNLSGFVTPSLGATVGLCQGTLGGTALRQYTASTNMYAVIHDYVNQLNPLYASYRIVACGIQFQNLIPPTTATGRLVFATVPCFGPVAFDHVLETVDVNAALLIETASGLAFPSLSAIPESILSLPTGETFTIQELITDPLEISIRPCGPRAMNFIRTRDDELEGDLFPGSALVFDVTTPTAPVSDGYASSDVLNCLVDWNSLLFSGSGFPASSAILEARLIFHIEAYPQVSAGVLGGQPSCRSFTGSSPGDAMDALYQTAKTKVMGIVAEKANKLAGKAGEYLLKTMSAKMGMMIP